MHYLSQHRPHVCDVPELVDVTQSWVWLVDQTIFAPRGLLGNSKNICNSSILDFTKKSTTCKQTRCLLFYMTCIAITHVEFFGIFKYLLNWIPPLKHLVCYGTVLCTCSRRWSTVSDDFSINGLILSTCEQEFILPLFTAVHQTREHCQFMQVRFRNLPMPGTVYVGVFSTKLCLMNIQSDCSEKG